MKIKEVIVSTEAEDAQTIAIKQQERALKIRKAQLKANKALQQLTAVRSANLGANK